MKHTGRIAARNAAHTNLDEIKVALENYKGFVKEETGKDVQGLTKVPEETQVGSTYPPSPYLPTYRTIPVVPTPPSPTHRLLAPSASRRSCPPAFRLPRSTSCALTSSGA